MRAICWCKLTKLMVCFLPLKTVSSFFRRLFWFFPSWLCLVFFLSVFLIYLLLILSLNSSICGFTLWMFLTMFALTLNSFRLFFFCNALIIISVFFPFSFSVVFSFLYCSKRFASLYSALFVSLCNVQTIHLGKRISSFNRHLNVSKSL